MPGNMLEEKIFAEAKSPKHINELQSTWDVLP